MDLGATLRHARERRGVTCEELARRTRIPRRLLVAMEQDEWAKLPGGIFTRGYLRAYAREVALDGEPLVAQFEAEHAPPPPPEPRAPAAAAASGWHLTVRWPRFILPHAAWRRLAWPAAAAVVLLALYLASGRQPSAEVQVAAGPAGAPADKPVNALGGPGIVPVGTAASPGASPGAGDVVLPLPGIETPLTLEVSVTRPCWVAVTVDGVRQVTGSSSRASASVPRAGNS